MTNIEQNEIIDNTLYNLFSCINASEARIDNGVDISKSFDWLRDEIERTFNGELIYNKQES